MIGSIIFDKDNYGMKIQVNIVDENGDVVDLTGSDVNLTVSMDYGESFTDNAVITDAENGLIEIYITQDYTKVAGNYNISIFVSNSTFGISCKDKIYYLVK